MTAQRKRICILSLAPVQSDGRVLRQIDYAAREYDVTVVGWGHLDRERPGVTMLPVERHTFPRLPRLLQVSLMAGGRASPGLYERWYWRKPDHHDALRLVKEAACDLIHVDEAIALPIGLAAARELRVPVLFDAHEFSPEMETDKLWGRLIANPYYDYLIRRYAVKADAMTTVAPGIAERYRRQYGVNPTVVMNAPHYSAQPFRPTDPAAIKLAHHGNAMRERHLERLIDIAARLDPRFTLQMMLVEKDPGYIASLKNTAEQVAPGKVVFRDPVPPSQIAATINQCDVGIHIVPPVNYNNAHMLPNKLFEFIMAGLAVVIGPSVEMVPIVREHGLGVIGENFEPDHIAGLVNRLHADEIDAMKRNSLAAAQLYNADVEMGKLLALWRGLLS